MNGRHRCGMRVRAAGCLAVPPEGISGKRRTPAQVRWRCHPERERGMWWAGDRREREFFAAPNHPVPRYARNDNLAHVSRLRM